MRIRRFRYSFTCEMLPPRGKVQSVLVTLTVNENKRFPLDSSNFSLNNKMLPNFIRRVLYDVFLKISK